MFNFFLENIMSKKEKMINFSIKGNLIGFLILFFTATFALSSCRDPRGKQVYIKCDLRTSSPTQKETGIKVSTILGCGTADATENEKEWDVDRITSFERKGENEFLLSSYRQTNQKITVDSEGKTRFADFILPNQGADEWTRFLGSDSNNFFILKPAPEGNTIHSVDAKTLASTKLIGGNREGSHFGSVGAGVVVSAPVAAAAAADALYFIDDYYVMKIELSGTNPVSRVFGWIHRQEPGDGYDSHFSWNPIDLLYMASNKLLVVDSSNNLIKEIDLNNNNSIKTIAGVEGSQDGWEDNVNPLLARFDWPRSIALSPGGDIYLADTGNCLIRKIAVNNGVYGAVTTVAGAGCSGNELKNTQADESGHHNAREAIFYSVRDLVFDGSILYMTDSFLFIRKVEFLDATP